MLDQFDSQVLGMLPKLRQQAYALTRDRAAADDLVQDAVVRALAARDGFQPGTNFAAWIRTILRNRFFEHLRKRRDFVSLDDAPAAFLAIPGDQENELMVKELEGAMGRLAPKLREALIMAVSLGMSYEAIAAATASGPGAVKTRIFRAREQLRTTLLGEGGEERPLAPIPAPRPSRRRSGPLLAVSRGF